MQDRFHKALLEGIENATNSEKFIEGVKKLLEKCNSELNNIKVNSRDILEFKMYHCDNLYVYQLGLPNHKNNEDTFSGIIAFNVNGKESQVMKIKNYSGAKYRITYLREEENLDFPNIDEFEKVFHDYLSTSSFGELIYDKVKLS